MASAQDRGRSRSIPVIWREVIRDSDLDKMSKLVAHTHSTHLDAQGTHYTSRDTLAREASVSDRTVDAANKTLLAGGFLYFPPGDRGGRSKTHTYAAQIPSTASPIHAAEWETANAISNEFRNSANNGEGTSQRAHPIAASANDVRPK